MHHYLLRSLSSTFLKFLKMPAISLKKIEFKSQSNTTSINQSNNQSIKQSTSKQSFYIKSVSICPCLAVSTSQNWLNGTHEFSELVLARMALLMDQSRSVLPLRSVKAREFGELWQSCTAARLAWMDFPYQLARTSIFGRPEQTNEKRCQHHIYLPHFSLLPQTKPWK